VGKLQKPAGGGDSKQAGEPALRIKVLSKRELERVYGLTGGIRNRRGDRSTVFVPLKARQYKEVYSQKGTGKTRGPNHGGWGWG